MTNFGSINSDASRAHLALIQGGGQDSSINATRNASRALGTAPTLHVAAAAARRVAATGYARTTAHEGPRSGHEAGIRAIARQFNSFTDALLPMVLASGVSGEAASTVVAAIQSNPALLAQAERAFDKAREASA